MAECNGDGCYESAERHRAFQQNLHELDLGVLFTDDELDALALADVDSDDFYYAHERTLDSCREKIHFELIPRLLEKYIADHERQQVETLDDRTSLRKRIDSIEI